MNNLSFVKSKVIEAVPEIMELKFGCRFIWKEIVKDYYEDGYTAIFENWKSRIEKTIRCLMHLGQQGIVEQSHIVKILGRPITLEDVLFTMLLKWHAQKRNFLISSSGMFVKMEGGLPFVYDVSWDLTKDLDGQSEETIGFLAEILR